jgi:GntR family transcriptional regulator, rspAB operon transcriptional repressor
MFPLSKKLPSENNKIYSYRAIKEGILSLQLQPGQALSLVNLAKILKVSTTPIREAMWRLQLEHLVEVIPQVGTYVSKIKPQLIEEAASIRLILEKEALQLACKSFPRESLDQLKKNLALQEMWLAQKGTAWDFKKLDKNFHYIIFQGNQRKVMWEAITQLAAHYHRMTMLSQEENDFYELIIDHKNIISIIENKEIDQVENILGKHILEPIEGWENLYHQESAFTSYFDVTEKSRILA